jgi:hypothetical protein
MVGATEAAWISEELASLSVKDKRVLARVAAGLGAMFAQPGASVRRMFGAQAGAKGLYRLLEGAGRQGVSAAEVTYAQQQATLRRCAGEALVLCVQDTTKVNISRFTSMTGGGPLPRGRGQWGFFVQTVLAVSVTGLPLGVLGQHYLERATDGPARKAEAHKHKPIAQKESYKWLRGVLESGVEQVNGTTMLFVSDQESDIFEYLTLPRPEHVQLLVRAQHNRRLTPARSAGVPDEAHGPEHGPEHSPEHGPEHSPAHGPDKLWDVVQASPVAGLIDVVGG